MCIHSNIHLCRMPRKELSKPALCDICQASFASRSNMKWHKWEKHGDRRFECPVCRLVCRQRLDALLEEHSRIKRYYEANRELIGTVTDRTPKTTKKNRKVLAPLQESSNLTPLRMSPSVAKQCEEILKGVDLFEGQEGYDPMNLDGTFPELNKVYHPTPVLAVNTAKRATEERTSTCTRAPLSPQGLHFSKSPGGFSFPNPRKYLLNEGLDII